MHRAGHMDVCAEPFAALEASSTHETTHDEWLKANKADSGGFGDAYLAFNKLEYSSDVMKLVG